MACLAIAPTAEAIRALDPAVQRDGHQWADILRWLEEGSAQIWQIDGTGYALTVANIKDEIEVVLAGGRNARGCVGPWEAAMRADPRHKGHTLTLTGRRGWKRLLPHWACEELGGKYVKLTTRVA